MRLEVRKYLFDIQRALCALQEFIGEKSFRDYAGDAMLRAATERQFEITGEALAQLAKREPAVASGITDYRQIIAFRNILIHGYAEIDDRLVWDIVETKLPKLRAEVGDPLQG
jgi:uncharacterized protein with HEPN domain